VAAAPLRLLATCCHPALSVDAQVALTLRLVCGLRTADIARLFLTSEPTVAQRLSRAKRKLRDAPIPLRAPTPDELPARLGPLLACIELVFTRGYAPVDDARVVVDELCDEGRRLAGLLAGLLPDEPEVRALHALLLFQDSRRTCRADDDGRLVLLAHQDRTGWDHATIAHGVAELTAAELVGRESPPGRYRLQAAIAGEHATAPDAAATDWHRIVALYDRLATVLPSPVVSLNRAVAVAERDGPDAGLAAIAGIADEPKLARGHRLAAVRAELLHRAGRVTEARDAYEVALAAAPDGAERRHLDRRREALETSERSRWRGPPTPDRVGAGAGQ
jgi:RNA polymerase sigma-70 factor, ECF subfamily